MELDKKTDEILDIHVKSMPVKDSTLDKAKDYLLRQKFSRKNNMGDVKDSNIAKKTKAVKTKKTFSLRKRILFAACSIVVIITATIGGLQLFNGIKLDYARGRVVLDRIANAQYVPPVEVLANNENDSIGKRISHDELKTNSILNNSFSDFPIVDIRNKDLGYDIKIIEEIPALSFNDYEDLVNHFGQITVEDQSGMRGKFMNITQVKDEILNILASTPAFDMWFSTLDEYNSYGGRAFYISYNESTQKITVKSVSDISSTKAVYSDEKQTIAEAQLRQLMEIDYYYEEDTEVVEMKVYNTMVFKNKTYPISYQYLKNIKNKSFTKIYIMANVRTYPAYDNEDYQNPYDYVPGGHNLTDFNEYGTIRTFTQFDYSQGNNMQLLAIDQYIPNYYYNAPATALLRFYGKADNEKLYYSAAYCYDNVEYYSHWLSPLGEYSNVIYAFTDGFEISFNRSPVEEYMNTCKQCYAIRESKTSATRFVVCNHYPVSPDIITELRFEIYKTDMFFLIYDYINDSITKLAGVLGMQNEQIKDYLKENKQPFDSYIIKDEYIYETNLDKFLNEISIYFVDNFTLRGYADGYLKAAKKAKKLNGNENVSATASVLDLSDINSIAVIKDNKMEYSLAGSVKPSILLKKGNHYSLSIALICDNYSYVLASSYAEYKGKELAFDYSGIYDFEDLKITQSGKYKMAVTLTGLFEDREVVVSKFYSIELDYEPVLKNDTTGDFHTTYNFSESGGDLFITAKVKDTEAPILTVNTAFTDEYGYVFDTPPYAGFLVNYFTIKDNVGFTSIAIYDDNGNKYSLLTKLTESGKYYVEIGDAAGNKTRAEITITVENP